MKKKIMTTAITALMVLSVFAAVALPMAGTVEANPDGTVKIAQIIHKLPSNYEVDDVALFNWLADYDTDVTQILILEMEGKSTDYWREFDVVILPGGCGLVPIDNLVSSEVPIIAMSTGHADELELGTGEGTLHVSTRAFYVRNNTHPITSGLTSGAWTWSGTGYMWTDATNNAGYDGTATVLVDSGEVGKDILIVHQTKKYAFFGWYRASQWPDEGWGLMEKTIEWAIDLPLPPFSMEFTVEITDPDTVYKPGDTIHIVVDTGKAGYTVTGSFSDLASVPKMAGVSYNLDTWQYPDVEYWMDSYLGSLGYTVEKIAQQTVETHSSEEWEAYDVVFISEGFASSHNLTNLIESNVPIIMTGNDDDYVLQAGLGDGYERDDKQTFYVTDNPHPITQGLTPGAWTFDSSMYTTRIGTEGFDVTVLIDDNGSPAKAYLATRQEPKRVWFGYYRGTQTGAEARDIFKNSIAWTLGKDSLPNLKADVTDNGDGTYSIRYTIGYVPLFGTHTILITVEDQVGHTVTNDSLSVTIKPPTEVWVDDGWNSQADVNLFNPDLIWQYDAFNTIQDGIDAVTGSTVNVAAGTYNEAIVIDRQLTLLGANHGVNATEERGPESIINAQGVPIAVLINGADTVATFDGFTVDDYDTVGILAGAFKDTLQEVPLGDDPVEVHILNNIVKPPTIAPPHNNNIQVGAGTTGTIIGNEVSGALLESPDWSGSGIIVASSDNVEVSNNYVHNSEGGIQILGYVEYQGRPAAQNNLIENNLVESNECGISVQANSIGTIIRYNDVLNNDFGIESMAYDLSWPEHSTPSGTKVYNNNIVSNENGVKSWVYGNDTGNVLAEQVDAALNWWGDPTGPRNPTTNPSATGDSVSDDVDYTPWLDAPHPGGTERSWNAQNVDTGDNFNSIQSAIKAASPGNTIIVYLGTYNEGSAYWLIDKPVSVIGAGSELVTIDRSASTSYGLNVSADDVRLQGFTFIGPSVDSNWAYGLKIEGSANLAIQDVRVTFSGRTGIDLNAVTDSTITNVVASSNGAAGVALTNCTDVTITGLRTSNNAWGGVAIFTSGSNISITESEFTGESNVGLYVQGGPAEDYLNISVTGNAFSENPVQVADLVGDVLDLEEILVSNTFDRAVVVRGSDIKVPVIFSSIQDAIDAAESGDTINVAAGIYEEEIKIMDKSLTLLGAQADVPIVNGERAGDESIIRGKVDWQGRPTTYCVVRIQHSDVIVNGFTIVNGKCVILMQGLGGGISDISISYNYIENSSRSEGFHAGIARANSVADVTIDHNYIAFNPGRGILTNGGATTITNNTFYGNGKGIDFHGGDPYDKYFPDYADPKYPTIISGNSFTNDSTSITLRLDRCHQSITITGNDITEARSAAIKTWNVYDDGEIVFDEETILVNPAIHYNNIWNNEFGINNEVAEINLDATYNWWGSENGPSTSLNTFNIGQQGDNVSANVDFTPWLDAAYPGGEPFAPVVNENTGENFSSIQSAIDNAIPGETVLVGPGIYKEHIVIDKSNLSLIGEDKETTIIDATQDSSWPVAKPGILIGEYPLVDGVHGVTVSGFTIRDAAMQEGGIPYTGEKYGVGPGGLAGIQIYNSDNNMIENNILINNYWQIWLVAEWPSAGYTTCRNNRIANNIIRDSEQDGVYLYSDGGVFVKDTEIVNNEIDNAYGEFASGVEFWGWPEGGDTPTISGTVIRNNDITNCTYGVRIREGVSDITGTLVNYNNISGNEEYGVLNTTKDKIDATYNWWGRPRGPRRGKGGSERGDRVSEKVLYRPWLTKPFQTVLEEHVGHYGFEGRHLGKGWNTFSAPIYLDNNAWEGIAAYLDENIAYRFNASTQAWELMTTDSKLDPLDAIYIRMNSENSVPLVVSVSITSPPVKELKKGWNLVGLAVWEEENMSVDRALVSVELTPDGNRGYTIVVNPSLNREPWTVYTIGQPGEKPLMNKNKAYWVYMENPGNLAGFSTTPLPFWEPE